GSLRRTTPRNDAWEPKHPAPPLLGPSPSVQGTPIRGENPLASKNFAARARRWSASHRKTAIFGWFAFVIAAFMIGGNLGTKPLSELDQGVGDSGRADRIVDKAFPNAAGEQVFIQNKTQKATDPQYRAAVRDIERRLDANPLVKKVKSPYAKAN